MPTTPVLSQEVVLEALARAIHHELGRTQSDDAARQAIIGGLGDHLPEKTVVVWSSRCRTRRYANVSVNGERQSVIWPSPKFYPSR